MMAGTEPSSNMPGAKPGVSRGERFESPWPNPVSRLILLARPEAAERTECTELARPSDLCDDVRSVSGRPPDLDRKSIDDLEACAQCP